MPATSSVPPARPSAVSATEAARNAVGALAVIGVSINPGCTMLTRIPHSPRASAAVCVAPRNAHLLVVFWHPHRRPGGLRGLRHRAAVAAEPAAHSSASRAGVGLAEAAIMTCATTLIADYFDGRRRDRYLGLQVVFTSISAVVFIGLSGALASTDWRTPFWFLYRGPPGLN